MAPAARWRQAPPDVRCEGMVNGIPSGSGVVQGSRRPIPTGHTSPQEAVAVGRTAGPVRPWRPSPDLNHLIPPHPRLPDPRGQALVHGAPFVAGTLHESTPPRLTHPPPRPVAR